MKLCDPAAYPESKEVQYHTVSDVYDILLYPECFTERVHNFCLRDIALQVPSPMRNANKKKKREKKRENPPPPPPKTTTTTTKTKQQQLDVATNRVVLTIGVIK